MLKEIKNPMLEIEANRADMEKLYTKRENQLLSFIVKCYLDMKSRKFAGHGICFGSIGETEQMYCDNCPYYFSIKGD